MALFSSDFLTRLEYLAIVSRRAFRGQLMAQKRTMQLGTGIEFADHRDYVPGDDFRYLDWNLYARHNELLLKRFQEEEDLHIYLLLDCSPSMGFGDPPKFDLARQLTAALAYIGLADLDRVAVIAFADRILSDFPLTRGKARILSLMKFLEQLEPSGQRTNLAEVVTSFVHRSQRRGMVVLLSDFFDPAGFEHGLNLLRHHRYEPNVVHLYEPGEAEPNLLGDVELIDAETATLKKITVTEKNLKQYQELFRQFLKSVADYCQGHEIGCTTSPASVAFDELILRMMRTAATIQ